MTMSVVVVMITVTVSNMALPLYHYLPLTIWLYHVDKPRRERIVAYLNGLNDDNLKQAIIEKMKETEFAPVKIRKIELSELIRSSAVRKIELSELIRSSADSWSIEPKLHMGCSIYAIKNSKCSDNTRETNEFNKYAAQFCKLLPAVSVDRVQEVQKIEYELNSNVLLRYQQKKLEFAAKDLPTERFVFHGTGQEKNFEAIAEEGFVVGGSLPGVPVANGAAYGKGVYTAIGPATPIQYSGKIAKVILALGLEGAKGDCNYKGQRNGNIDTISVQGKDWLIFTSSDQLLPVAIIVFNKVGS